MGTRAHWHGSRYYGIATDIDGLRGSRTYGDTIAELKDDLFASSRDVVEVEVWRQYKSPEREPELAAHYVWGEAGITRIDR